MSKQKILIVDDEPVNITVLVEILSESYDLLVATDGKKALQIVAADNCPDIILLDVLMPDMDGYEVAEHLKSNEKTKDIPFIFLTAQFDSDSVVKGFKLGSVDYISKPFAKEELLVRVKTHLELYTLKNSLTKALSQSNEQLEIIKKYSNEIESYKNNLEERVAQAVAEIESQNILLLKQSKFAAMGEMIGMIAHQLKQPLNGLSVISQSYKIVYELDSIDEEYLIENEESSMKFIRYMSETIDNFRNFFQTDKNRELVDINNLIDDSIKFVSHTFHNSNIKIVKNYYQDSKIELHVFRNELLQVFLNILNNAKDALNKNNNDSEKIIRITTYIKNDKFIVDIEDNAGGVEKSVIDQIFNSYFSTKGDKGTGLGLYMSKLIVEDHLYGSISVKNTDNGAKFTIELSLSDDH